MSLRPRLNMVANMVRQGSVSADIGTDHGYLPAFLVKSGKCPFGIAADLRKSPLENAKETLRIYGVEDKVKVRLSDGLDLILPDECDDIVFAGMGGTLIVELLSRTPWIKDKVKRFIFQPMSHSEDVREFLCKNGFTILSENACFDDGRDYIAFCAEYTGENSNKDELYYYIGSHPIDGNTSSFKYVKKQIFKINKRYTSLVNAQIISPERDKLQKVLTQFQEAKLWQE